MAFDGVTFATTDGTKWGAGKGAPLTAIEADNDLWELLRRLNAIEDTPPSAVSISNILVSGSQLSFQMSDGSSFGPFTLPIATFRLRGDYVPGTHYFELDLVSVPQQGLFLVRLEHNGANPFNPAATDGSGHAIYLKVFGEDTYIYDVGFFYPGVPGMGIQRTCCHAGSRRLQDFPALSRDCTSGLQLISRSRSPSMVTRSARSISRSVRPMVSSMSQTIRAMRSVTSSRFKPRPRSMLPRAIYWSRSN